MTRNKALACVFILLAACSSLWGAEAAAATPSFTISAANVTMPSSGIASVAFTLTSVDGFAGSVVLGLTPPNVPAGTRLPYEAFGGPVMSYSLTANGSVTKSIGLLSTVPVPVPVGWKIPRRGNGVVWELAGVLMLGFRLRRKRALRSTRMMLALGMLMGSMGLGACGGLPTLTPGTYAYTLSATEVNNTSLSASTTVLVTVPPGIVTRTTS